MLVMLMQLALVGDVLYITREMLGSGRILGAPRSRVKSQEPQNASERRPGIRLEQR